MTRPPHVPATTGRISILSPAIDLLCAGGLSLIVFVPLLLSGRTDLVIVGAGVQAVLGTVINMPHFMASYRIVYRSREMILRHKWASIYVPAFLLVYVVVAVWEAQTSPFMVTILVFVSSAYLAWHYTGQVWGMMASYAYLEGTSFDKTERRLVRTSLYILLAWHVSWALYTTLRDPSTVEPLYVVISGGTLVALLVGAIGLEKMRRRTGRVPPIRTLVAWIAIFVWYAVMARDKRAIFWIQIAHALQYLSFPIRVEINRTATGEGRGAAETRRGTAKSLAVHMAAYGAILLAVSFVAQVLLPAGAMSAVGDLFGEDASRVAPVLVLMFINIHHYFTDGVIWKISNPEVRKELFAHVPSPAGRGSKAAPAARPG